MTSAKFELKKADTAAKYWYEENPKADPQSKLQALEEILCKIQTWPTQVRPNVSPDEKPVTGLVFGAVYVLGGKGMQSSLWTQSCKNLARLCLEACKETIPKQNGQAFPFSSIQINYNYAAKKHIDGNNIGPSYIISLGNHQGGELWVGDTFVQDDDGIMRGGGGEAVINCHRTWSLFNGCAEHYTQPFSKLEDKKMQRISLVCFSHSRYNQIPEEVGHELKNLGFNAILSNVGEELDFFKSFRLDKSELSGEALKAYEKIKKERRALRPRDDIGTICVEANGYSMGRGAGFFSIARGAVAKKRRIDAFFAPKSSSNIDKKCVHYELPNKQKNSVSTKDIESTVDDAGLVRIELPKNRTGFWLVEINPKNYAINALERFDVYSKTAEQSSAFARYVDQLPTNTIVCIGITDTAMAATRPLPASIYDSLRKLGGSQHLEPIGYRQPFCFIGAKDLPQGEAHMVLEKTKVIVRLQARVQLNTNTSAAPFICLIDKHTDLFDVTAHITTSCHTTLNEIDEKE